LHACRVRYGNVLSRALDFHGPLSLFTLRMQLAPRPVLFPYTTLFRSYDYMGMGEDFYIPDCLEVHSANINDYDELYATASIEERSEEHTSELQSRFDLVCRLLLEKKNNISDCIALKSVSSVPPMVSDL